MIPAPTETKAKADSPAALLRFVCPACGQKIAAKPELAGKQIRCSGCGATVRAGGRDAAAVGQPARSFKNSDGSSNGGAVRRRPAPENEARAGTRGPADLESVDPSSTLDALATISGEQDRKLDEPVLPSRSESMQLLSQGTSGHNAAERRVRERNKNRNTNRKPKSSGDFFDPKETLRLIGTMSVVVVLLAYFATAVPAFRFVVGGLLCVIGVLVYIMAAITLMRTVPENKPLEGLLVKVCPPFQWWYVFNHWSATKECLAFFIAGIVFVAIGVGVLKISEPVKKAEASESATQGFRPASQPAPPVPAPAA